MAAGARTVRTPAPARRRRAWPGPGPASPRRCGPCCAPRACPRRRRPSWRRRSGTSGARPSPGDRAGSAGCGSRSGRRPPRLLDWMSGQVLEHPAVALRRPGGGAPGRPPDPVDRHRRGGPAAGPGRGGRGLDPRGGTGPGPGHRRGGGPGGLGGPRALRLVQHRLLSGPRASVTRESPWTATEVRRLTNAALMSKGSVGGPSGPWPARPSSGWSGGWVGRGVVDALPFGSSLGRASVRAAARIDQTDLAALVQHCGSALPAVGGGGALRRLRAPWTGTTAVRSVGRRGQDHRRDRPPRPPRRRP